MKKYFGVLAPAFASVAILSLAVACAPDKASDVVNARRGKPCDSTTQKCDPSAVENVYGKLGADSYVDDLLKELEAVNDSNQKAANKKAAKEIRNMNYLIDGSKATVTVTTVRSNSTVLSGEFKDGKAELTNEDNTVKASLECIGAATCKVARVDVTKTTLTPRMVVTGKLAQNQTIKADVNSVEKASSVTVKAILRDSEADISAVVDADIANKSDATKKLYDLITAKALGRQDQNTIKAIRTQISHIANGAEHASIVIVSNENEVIGLQGNLQIIGKDTQGKTAVDMKREVSENVLKSMQVTGELKKTIHNSLKAVTLTSIDSGNKLGFKFDILGKDGKTIESVNSTLLLTQIASSGDAVAPVVPVADKKTLDAKAVVETEAEAKPSATPATVEKQETAQE